VIRSNHVRDTGIGIVVGRPCAECVQCALTLPDKESIVVLGRGFLSFKKFGLKSRFLRHGFAYLLVYVSERYTVTSAALKFLYARVDPL